MTDPAPSEPEPPPDEAPKPAPLPSPPPQGDEPLRPRPPQRSAQAVLTALGFALTFILIGVLWQRQQLRPPLPPAADPAEVAALETQLRGLQNRVAQLEQRPAPAPPPDLSEIESRLKALEHRPTAPSVSDDQLAALENRLAQGEARATQLAQRADRLATVQAAQQNLVAGRALGDIRGAPPALSRFATAPPPTEAALRLEFPALAARAAAASQPANPALSLGERIWQRVAALVTVREGSRIIVGSPAQQVLAEAQGRLDAGDLAGAVAALRPLDGPAAQVMAEWRDRAQALLDAREALAGMARG